MRLPGHPDAVCDLVAEAIVDEYLRRDEASRLQLNVHGGHGALFVTGDVLSKADFDVAAVAKRAMAQAGVMSDIEPFVSLEAVASEQVSHVLAGGALPVTVMGYATSETSEGVPTALAAARDIARDIERRRAEDEAWFWAGADGEVSVGMRHDRGPLVHVRVEQGTASLEDARRQVTDLVRNVLPAADVYMNASGAQAARGLALVSGASGRDVQPYGHGLPALASPIGLDLRHPRKAGAWVARAAAREALKTSGAKAVLLHATYLPGDDAPAHVVIRDERGRDLASHVRRDGLALRRAVEEWARPGLSPDAARWGFAGTAELPWES